MHTMKETRLYAVLLSREEMEGAVSKLPKGEPIVARLTDALTRTVAEPAPPAIDAIS